MLVVAIPRLLKGLLHFKSPKKVRERKVEAAILGLGICRRSRDVLDDSKEHGSAIGELHIEMGSWHDAKQPVRTKHSSKARLDIPVAATYTLSDLSHLFFTRGLSVKL